MRHAAGTVDQESFARFYREHFHDVERAVSGIVGAAAPDVAQDAFVVALNRRSEVGSLDKPLAWLRKVAVRLAWRRASRERERSRVEGLESPPTEGSHLPGLDLEGSLNGLAITQRQAVELFYLQDRPLHEIAEILRRPPATIKTWLHRARPVLAAHLLSLHGRWVSANLLSRSAIAERVRASAATHEVDVVMDRMPARPYRPVLKVEGPRYEYRNEDGESVDHGAIRADRTRLWFRSYVDRKGWAVYRFTSDGNELALRLEASTMAPTDGVADDVFQRILFDGLRLDWRGKRWGSEPIPKS